MAGCDTSLLQIIFTFLLSIPVMGVLAVLIVICRKMITLVSKQDQVIEAIKNGQQSDGNNGVSESKQITETQLPPIPPDHTPGSQEPEYDVAMDEKLQVTKNTAYELVP